MQNAEPSSAMLFISAPRSAARVGEPRLAADRPPVARVIVIADLLNLRHNVRGTTRTEPTLDEA